LALEILSPILLPEKNIMLLQYVEAAAKKAQYKQLEDDSWFAEISGYPGVWANATTIEDCRTELIEVIEEWEDA